MIIRSYALIFFGGVTGDAYLAGRALNRLGPVAAPGRGWAGTGGTGSIRGGAARCFSDAAGPGKRTARAWPSRSTVRR